MTATTPQPSTIGGKPRRVRLGWLGPAIVALGVAVAAAGIIYVLKARPAAGAEIQTLRVNDTDALVVRAEAGGDRNFVELRRSGHTVWQSIVPAYAGRPDAPGLAWNAVAVSVRVVRDARAEVFVVSMRDGSKLGGFGLAPEHGVVTPQRSGPVTITDHERSYELVQGEGWHHVTAFDLTTGKPLWSHDLGAAAVTAGSVAGCVVTLVQGGHDRRFDCKTGIEAAPSS